MPQDTKEIIQFKHIDHEQVAEKQQAAYKKRATLHGAFGGEEQQKRVQSTLKRRKLQRSRTRFKRRRIIHLKHSNIEQPQRRRRWLRCNRSGETVSKFMQRTQELTRTQHEDGKQDAWNGHAQVASQAMAVPEEYGPDTERQEVKRDEQESRTAQQQVKKTTSGRVRRESSVTINEYESDRTSRTKQFSQLQTWRNHS